MMLRAKCSRLTMTANNYYNSHEKAKLTFCHYKSLHSSKTKFWRTTLLLLKFSIIPLRPSCKSQRKSMKSHVTLPRNLRLNCQYCRDIALNEKCQCMKYVFPEKKLIGNFLKLRRVRQANARARTLASPG